MKSHQLNNENEQILKIIKRMEKTYPTDKVKNLLLIKKIEVLTTQSKYLEILQLGKTILNKNKISYETLPSKNKCELIALSTLIKLF